MGRVSVVSECPVGDPVLAMAWLASFSMDGNVRWKVWKIDTFIALCIDKIKEKCVMTIRLVSSISHS